MKKGYSGNPDLGLETWRSIAINVMIGTAHRAYLLTVLAGASLATILTTGAFAADTSAWDEDQQSSARLVAAAARDASGVRTLRAGIEIKLKNGWHTYWRYPGDSGVPPVFDFSKSQNVKHAEVRYPAPRKFPDGAGGQSIGYTGDVIWPVDVVPSDPSRPAVLHVAIDYAVCEKLCIPAKANLELSVNGGSSAAEAVVSAAEARVPKQSKIGDEGPLAVRAVHREAGGGKPRIVVDVAATEPVTLLAEGPTVQWALPLPEPAPGAPAGQHRFAFDLDGLPPGETGHGAMLRLTAVAGDKAIEVGFRLD
jgi:DsbC/DsbD-like thiol-disulfide interchange protein